MSDNGELPPTHEGAKVDRHSAGALLALHVSRLPIHLVGHIASFFGRLIWNCYLYPMEARRLFFSLAVLSLPFFMLGQAPDTAEFPKADADLRLNAFEGFTAPQGLEFFFAPDSTGTLRNVVVLGNLPRGLKVRSGDIVISSSPDNTIVFHEDGSITWDGRHIGDATGAYLAIQMFCYQLLQDADD